MNRLRRTSIAFLSSASALILITGLAAAAPTLYHSPGDTGVDPSTVPTVPMGTTETLHLYFNPGTTTTTNGGQICNGGAGGTGGDGDETCGVHFKIGVTGDVSILSFTPLVGTAEFNNTGTEINASLLTTAPGDILPTGATKIATMDIDVSGTQGGVGSVTLLNSVDADLDLVAGTNRDVFFVPEPSTFMQLTFGALALAALRRLGSMRSPSRGDARA